MGKRWPENTRHAAAASATPPEFFSLQVAAARRFYLDLAPPPDVPLAVVCGGCEESLPDYEIHRQTFPYYSIEFVARGQGTLSLDAANHLLLPGSLFTYGPHIAQDIVSDRRDPLVKYFVDFTGTQAQRLLEQYNLPPGSVVHIFALGEVEAVFDMLIRDGCQATGFTAALCRCLLEYLLMKIVESRVPGKTGQTPAWATYQRCRHYIMDHCETLMSLDQVARACLLDRAYLCRLFRRYDHQTPHQFLMRRKMHMAAQRLQDSDALVKQVSARLGFTDPFHFSRSFKRVLGLSPEAFRQQQR